MDARERHLLAKEIFLEAIDEPLDGRRALVQLRARGDAALLDDVLSLLSHHVDAPLMAADRAAPRREVTTPDRTPTPPATGAARTAASDGRTTLPHVDAEIVAGPKASARSRARAKDRAWAARGRRTRRGRRLMPLAIVVLATTVCASVAWIVARAPAGGRSARPSPAAAAGPEGEPPNR